MSWIGSIIGTATGSAVSTTLNGVGDAAIKIREAIIGDMPAEKRAEIELKLADLDKAVMEARSNVIIAEATGDSWIQKSWRPLLMMVIIAIIANNYLLFPYMSLFTSKVVILELPDRLYTLMEIGVGGYILGRTAEKVRSN